MGKASNGVGELNCHLDWFYIWVFLLLTCILSLSDSMILKVGNSVQLSGIFYFVVSQMSTTIGWFMANASLQKLVDFGSQWKT